MVKYCKNCGKELEDGAVFCIECGKPINNNIKTSTNTNSSFNTNFDPFNLYKIDMITGEKVLKRSQIHIGCLYAPALVTAFGLLSILSNLVSLDWYYINPIIFFFNPIFIIGLIWLIIRYIAYKNTDLILTNKRVFGKTGLISTIQMQSPLNKINSVSYSNGLIGKLLGYGTVRVATASTQYKFRFLMDGQTLYNDIFNQLIISEKDKIKEQAEANAMAFSKK